MTALSILTVSAAAASCAAIGNGTYTGISFKDQTELKNLLLAGGIGAHIRTKEGHSVILVSITDSGFVLLDANGNSSTAYNRISVRSYAWKDYKKSCLKAGISYIQTIKG